MSKGVDNLQADNAKLARDLSSVEELLKSDSWEERLEKARAMREEALRKRGGQKDDPPQAGAGEPEQPAFQTAALPPRPWEVDQGDAPSLDEVLETPNLNDRFHLAQERHEKILAREREKTGGEMPGASDLAKDHKETILFALAGDKALKEKAPAKPLGRKKKAEAEAGAAVGAQQGVAAAAQQPEKRRKKLVPLFVAGALAIAGFAGYVAMQKRPAVLPQTTAQGTSVQERAPVAPQPAMNDPASSLEADSATTGAGRGAGGAVPAARVSAQAPSVLAQMQVELVAPQAGADALAKPASRAADGKVPRDLAASLNAQPSQNPLPQREGPYQPELAKPRVVVSDIPAMAGPLAADGPGLAALPDSADVAPVLLPGPGKLPPAAAAHAEPVQHMLASAAPQAAPFGPKAPALPEAGGLAPGLPEKAARPPASRALAAGLEAAPQADDAAPGMKKLPPYIAFLPARPYKVSVHAPSGVKEDMLNSFERAFSASGFNVGAVKRVRFKVSSSNVRFFHAEDAPAARALAQMLGAKVRDFTGFRPRPAPGTIEIWVAGKPAAGARPAPGARAGGARAGTSSHRRAQMQALRKRLLNQLRGGQFLSGGN